MGLLDNLNFSQPFSLSSLLPSEAQLQAYKDKSDAEAVAQFSQDPNPVRRVPFNLLTALGVNPTLAQAAPTTLDVAPITGDASAIADAKTAFGKGDYVTGGLLSMAALPFVPSIVGKGKGLLKQTDDAKPLLNVDAAPKQGIEYIPPTDNSAGIIAFHGSGADFDKFSLSKIGTGEGNQAFGYGLYFTDSEDIANFYKNAMREKSTTGITKTVSYKGKNIDINNIDTFEDSFAYANADISPEKTKEKLLKEKERLEKDIASNNEAIKRINSGESYPSLIGNETISASSFEKNNLYQQPRLDAVNNVLNNLSDLKVLDTAKTYKVALAPKPDELLDYDLPFGQQNKFIKERLSKVANEMTVDDAINLGFDPFDFGNNNQAAINAAKKEMLKDDQSVVAFLNNWAVFRGEQGAGEKLLNKHGIKGIKYKADQGVGARNVPETGKNNYVIFDENLINILAKYGIVGGVGITALQNNEGL